MNCLMGLILALCCLVTPALADDALLNHALEMALRMDALASDKAYMETMTASPAITDMAAAWGEEEHSHPTAILHADVALDLVETLGFPTNLSNTALEELGRKLPLSLPSMLNGTSGAETLAATTVCTVSTLFACDAQGSGLYVLLYEHAAPVAVAWYAENGAVQMQGTFLADADAYLELPLTFETIR